MEIETRDDVVHPLRVPSTARVLAQRAQNYFEGLLTLAALLPKERLAWVGPWHIKLNLVLIIS